MQLHLSQGVGCASGLRFKKIKDQVVDILMTLTSPNCPVAESLPMEIEEAAAGVEGVSEVNVELTFEPPFTSDMMSEEAKFELGMM